MYLFYLLLCKKIITLFFFYLEKANRMRHEQNQPTTIFDEGRQIPYNHQGLQPQNVSLCESGNKV